MRKAILSGAVLIRDCTASDLAAVTGIYHHAVLHGTGTFELVPPCASEMQARFEKITLGGYPYLVAERDGTVLGYAYAGAFRERPAYRFLAEDSIYIRDGYQGQGIGAALLGRLVAVAAARGFRQMAAVIGDSANHGSIKLHSNAGFEVSGVLRNAGWKFGRWLDVVLMQKQLGLGASAPAVDATSAGRGQD